jgi:hypothetical protein
MARLAGIADLLRCPFLRIECPLRDVSVRAKLCAIMKSVAFSGQPSGLADDRCLRWENFDRTEPSRRA